MSVEGAEPTESPNENVDAVLKAKAQLDQAFQKRLHDALVKLTAENNAAIDKLFFKNKNNWQKHQEESKQPGSSKFSFTAHKHKDDVPKRFCVTEQDWGVSFSHDSDPKKVGQFINNLLPELATPPHSGLGDLELVISSDSRENAIAYLQKMLQRVDNAMLGTDLPIKLSITGIDGKVMIETLKPNEFKNLREKAQTAKENKPKKT